MLLEYYIMFFSIANNILLIPYYVKKPCYLKDSACSLTSCSCKVMIQRRKTIIKMLLRNKLFTTVKSRLKSAILLKFIFYTLCDTFVDFCN